MKVKDVMSILGNHPFKHMLKLTLYKEILNWLLDPIIFKMYHGISKMNKILPREEQVSALEVIDYVVIFNEDTPKEIILELKPDIQAKGGDYKEDEIPEKEALESYGGELRILSKVDCDSTTELISKL